jgi:hypothetical protein
MVEATVGRKKSVDFVVNIYGNVKGIFRECGTGWHQIRRFV